jgi:competence transcription factor ComK
VNCYETKNYVFVHSTLPTTSSDWNEAVWISSFLCSNLHAINVPQTSTVAIASVKN